MQIKKLFNHQSYYMQAPFLFPDRRFHMLVAGYGAGKTSSNATQAESLIKTLQGKRDKEGHRPRLLLGGITLGHLEKTVLSYIKQDLELSKSDFTHDKKNNIFTVGDVDVILVPLQNPKEITGYDVWASILEEIDDLGLSAAEDTTFEAIKAVNERTRQVIPGLRSPFIAMGSTSQGQRGLYRLYTQFRKAGTGFTLVRGRTADNTSLDPEYVQSLYEIYSPIEREVYLEGKFLALSRGQVFGDFDWNRNYLDYPMDQSVGDNEVLYWGQDFNQGYHRGCVAVLRGGTIYIVKRYEFPEIRPAPSVVRHDFPRQKIFFLPDSTAKEEITHFTRELRVHDIRLVLRSKNPLVEDSTFLVNKLLYTKRLMVAKSARETAEALSLAQRDSKGMIPKGVGPSSPIHDCLAGDTTVTTLRGNTRIRDVVPGDMVLTRDGWKKVTTTACKGVLPTKVYAGVRSTAEHPFISSSGTDIACGSLTQFDSCLTITSPEVRRWRLLGYQERLASRLKELSLTEQCIIGTQINQTVTEDTLRRRRESGCMWRFGSTIMGLSKTAITSIIKTVIQRTTGLRILLALLNMSTYRKCGVKSSAQQQEKTSRKPYSVLQNGTVVLKVLRGTADTGKRLWRSVLCRSLFAVVAEELSTAKDRMQSFVQQGVKTSTITTTELGRKSVCVLLAELVARWTSSASQSTARPHVPHGIGERPKNVAVYDISVEDAHEFFANGILVRNCDSVRMLSFFLACNRSELADIRKVTIERRLDLMEEEPKMEELNQGYVSISPSSF